MASDIRGIGRALDAVSRAEQIAGRFDALDAGAVGRSPIPVLVEWWPKPVIVPGGKSWVTEMLALAGACNPFSGIDRRL